MIDHMFSEIIFTAKGVVGLNKFSVGEKTQPMQYEKSSDTSIIALLINLSVASHTANNSALHQQQTPQFPK